MGLIFTKAPKSWGIVHADILMFGLCNDITFLKNLGLIIFLSSLVYAYITDRALKSVFNTDWILREYLNSYAIATISFGMGVIIGDLLFARGFVYYHW